MPRTSNETRVTDIWPKLKKSLASVPFITEEVIASYYCAFDPRHAS